MKVYYIAQNQLWVAEAGHERAIPCGAVEGFKRNLMEIAKRGEWKKSGAGAVFMGVAEGPLQAEHIQAGVRAVLPLEGGRICYAAALEDNCGLYIKPELDCELSAEGYVVRKNGMWIYDLDRSAQDGKIIASVSDGAHQRHLALMREDSTAVDIITEGESIDLAPRFSRQRAGLVHYASAGIYVDLQSGAVHSDSLSVLALDMATGEVETVLQGGEFDYLRPGQSVDGWLYYIRRPHGSGRGKGPSIGDVAMAPLRVIKAVGGWLNFFTQRYAGESLTKQSGGVNPGKYSNKSDREIFIDGNLIDVEKTLKENARQGDQHPGLAPRSWELMRMSPSGAHESVRKGVIDYAFGPDGAIVYSNGRYILSLDVEGKEEALCRANVATGLACEGEL